MRDKDFWHSVVSRDIVSTETIYVQYSLGLDNTLRIGLTLLKSRVKGLRRFEQGDSRCKIAGMGWLSVDVVAQWG
jgi:hypothetical protein